MRYFLIVFVALITLLTACVPNRKYLYFQKNDLHKKNATDTVVRKYTLEDFDYKIQPNDIIKITYQSLTGDDFDFLGKSTSSGSSSLSGSGSSSSTGSGSSSSVMVAGALLLGDIVDMKGEIPIPIVGKMKVAGLTIFQIQDTLQSIVANKYLEAPIVRVRLINYRATILGAVLMEGHITFTNNRVSLPEAIGMAGGLDELADRSNIKIIRQHGSKAEIHYVDLLDEDFLKSPFYYVHQNDLIIVPPLRQRPYRKYFGQNLSLFLTSVSFLLLIVTLNKK